MKNALPQWAIPSRAATDKLTMGRSQIWIKMLLLGEIRKKYPEENITEDYLGDLERVLKFGPAGEDLPEQG